MKYCVVTPLSNGARLFSTRLPSVSSDVLCSILLFGVGILAAFTPCTLGMLPITLAYLGRSDGKRSTFDVALNAIFYAVGIAMAFSSFGLSAVYFGNVVGSFNNYFPIASKLFHVITSVIFISMGLNLLDLITIRFPSLTIPVPAIANPSRTAELVGALILGATSALLEAPCTSPILASLLAFLTTLASTANPSTPAGADAVSVGEGSSAPAYILGATFMFLFSMGYATPLVMLGLAGRKVGEGALQLGRNFSQSAGATLLNTLAAVLIVYGSYQACASVEELLQRTAGS